MRTDKKTKRGHLGRQSATVAFLLVFCFLAHPLFAEEETQTAFQTLESYVQSREIPLETGNPGLAVLGVVVGAGGALACTWVGLLPVIQEWEPEDGANDDSGHGDHGLYLGIGAGSAVDLLAASIAGLAYPPSDVRAAYAGVLDVVEPVAREEAALAALRHFGEQSKKRKRLKVLLSVAGISAAIAPHVGVSAGMGNLDDYSDVVGGFALISAAMLFFPFYSLLFDDQPALLYQRYMRSKS